MLAILIVPILAFIQFKISQEQKLVTLVNQGLEFFRKGAYQRAIDLYDEALKINPKYSPALTNKGIAYGHMKNHTLEMYSSCEKSNKQ
jgi:tetratricopeptide (TPR) repeat protein